MELAQGLGWEYLAVVAILRAGPAAFGPVASDPRDSRLIDTLADSAESALGAIRARGPASAGIPCRLAGRSAPDSGGKLTVDLDVDGDCPTRSAW